MRNLRKILSQEGYSGAALEERIKTVLARDPSRLASIFSEEAKAEAKALGADAVVTYQKMTPAQRRIVDAVKSPTMRLPESLTTAEQIEEWMKANGM